MKSLTNYQLERFTTVEFLPFGLDWTCVAEIQFSENKDLPNDNDPPRRQKVRNSTVELAADLQLPISKPFILDVIPGFAEAIPDAEISRLVRESSTVAFGSQKLPTQFGAWNAGNRITKA